MCELMCELSVYSIHFSSLCTNLLDFFSPFCRTSSPNKVTHPLIILFVFIVLCLLTGKGSAQAVEIQADTAVLRCLDKVTARVSTFEVPVGQTLTVESSTLKVSVFSCARHILGGNLESAAFLDILEVKPGEPAVNIFRGWMFAYAPVLSAMDHPVYDLWLLSCHNSNGSRPLQKFNSS